MDGKAFASKSGPQRDQYPYVSIIIHISTLSGATNSEWIRAGTASKGRHQAFLRALKYSFSRSVRYAVTTC